MSSDPFAPFRLDGRVAVVTGGASGIGAGTAETLAAAGASVVLGDIDEAGAKAVAQRIAEAGGSALAQRCDVSRRDEVDALVARACDELGGLDAMCNVAGVPSDGPLLEVDEAELDRVIAINLKGVLFGSQAAARAMRARGGGSIVNVASAGADMAHANYGVYGMTKAAVVMLTQTLALEEASHGIRANVLAPGSTITAFTSRRFTNPDGSVDPAKREQAIAQLTALSPLGIVGEVRDQALLALYLVSDASRFSTGQVWRANGGQVVVR